MDKLMHQQNTMIAVALKVQRKQNSKNLEKWHKTTSEHHAYTQNDTGGT